jgi:Rrf2 family transcriptional regulator, nitric oxide-sensitive transcriptional repressor
VVRMAEKDFAVVQCQDMALEADCAVFQACNLKRGLRRAVDAFMQELDKMTFEEAVSAPAVAASLLGMAEPVAVALPPRGSGRRTATDVQPLHQPAPRRRVAPTNVQ